MSSISIFCYRVTIHLSTHHVLAAAGDLVLDALHYGTGAHAITDQAEAPVTHLRREDTGRLAFHHLPCRGSLAPFHLA